MHFACDAYMQTKARQETSPFACISSRGVFSEGSVFTWFTGKPKEHHSALGSPIWTHAHTARAWGPRQHSRATSPEAPAARPMGYQVIRPSSCWLPQTLPATEVMLPHIAPDKRHLVLKLLSSDWWLCSASPEIGGLDRFGGQRVVSHLASTRTRVQIHSNPQTTNANLPSKAPSKSYLIYDST